jgi:phospholipid transport system substrate-binding protein
MTRLATRSATVALALCACLASGARADEARADAQAAAAAPAASDAPKLGPAGPATAAVKKASDHLRDTIKKLAEAKEVDWQKARDEARKAVSSLLDFEALAEGTLGSKWAEVSKVVADKERYVKAMQSAMEASYLSRMQGKAEAATDKVNGTTVADKKKAVDDVKIDYLGETTTKDGKPVVHTKVTAGKDSVAISYVMAKVGKAKEWKAVDLITEEISLAETYREQITALWPKKKFEGVVAAFEKKAKRFEAELEEKRKKL